jgi:hypothetical protein
VPPAAGRTETAWIDKGFDRLWIVRYRNKMLSRDDVALTRALERCQVPPAGFPHASHLRVAWVYLNESPSLDHAVEQMSMTLRRFAASVGKAEKYSEPTTVFWMLQVAAARAAMPGADLDVVLRAYPRLLDKNLMRADGASHVIASGSAHSPSDTPDRPLPGHSA